MPKFRKKPIEIEARLFTSETADDVLKWINSQCKSGDGEVYQRYMFGDPQTLVLVIPTLEGDMEATEGDYIIQGIKGEFYPCKPDIFNATYERVE